MLGLLERSEEVLGGEALPRAGRGLSGGRAPSVRVLTGGGLLKIMTGSVRCSGYNLASEVSGSSTRLTIPTNPNALALYFGELYHF